MRRVVNRHRERVAEYGLGFLKADSMLLEVSASFAFVPIKIQVGLYRVYWPLTTGGNTNSLLLAV